MNQIASILKSTQDKNSSESKLIHCTNSEAIEMGIYLNTMPIKNCNYCNRELEQSGFFLTNSFLTKWMSKGEYVKCTCKKSEDYWKKEQQKKERDQSEEAERQYRVRLKKMMKYSNLGERFIDRTFSTFKITNENKMPYETCIRYVEKFKDLRTSGIGLLITGNYGSGKTHLVAAIAHELMKQGYRPIFGTLIILLEKIKSSYGESYSKENEEQIIRKYINCDLLIIDDLGKEKPSEWMLEKLYYIINYRYESNRPIIITSNYDDSKLISRLTVGDNVETAEAIVSRMYEMCQGVNMKGCKDYRRV